MFASARRGRKNIPRGRGERVRRRQRETGSAAGGTARTLIGSSN